MLLSEELEEHQDALNPRRNDLYRSIERERSRVERKKGHLYHTTLWTATAPAGNIYRYLMMASEHHKHAEDIGRQMEELAERHARLLGGPAAPLEVRTQKLIAALERVRVRGDNSDEESGEGALGFTPVLEFLGLPVQRLGPILFPQDHLQFMSWLTHRAIAVLICVVQLVAPVVLFIDEWGRDANRLRHPRQFLNEFTFNEVFCLGTNSKDRLHTIMGAVLLQLVVLIIHSYILEQHTDSRKSGPLPKDNFWYVLGNVTNQICTMATLSAGCIYAPCARVRAYARPAAKLWLADVVATEAKIRGTQDTFKEAFQVTILAAPILFWNEDTPTSMAMDSLTVLFVFMLDDFSGYACSYMGKSEASYSRATAWQKGLLSQCPVRLADIVDATAASANELWCIRFNASGQLLVARPEGEAGPGQVCRRRLEAVVPDENTPLAGKMDHFGVWYQIGQERGCELPGLNSHVVGFVWKVMDKFSLVVQFMLPVAWMAVNKVCAK